MKTIFVIVVSPFHVRPEARVALNSPALLISGRFQPSNSGSVIDAENPSGIAPDHRQTRSENEGELTAAEIG